MNHTLSGLNREYAFIHQESEIRLIIQRSGHRNQVCTRGQKVGRDPVRARRGGEIQNSEVRSKLQDQTWRVMLDIYLQNPFNNSEKTRRQKSMNKVNSIGGWTEQDWNKHDKNPWEHRRAQRGPSKCGALSVVDMWPSSSCRDGVETLAGCNLVAWKTSPNHVTTSWLCIIVLQNVM